MDDLLALPTDELLANVGRALEPDLLLPRSFSETVGVGREWLLENADELRRVLCRQAVEIDSSPDPATAVAAIHDLLSPMTELPAVASLSVVVYRFGVAQLCKEWP